MGAVVPDTAVPETLVPDVPVVQDA